MSILVDRDSRVIIQGFTGQHASFHAQESIRGGTRVVGGVTPGKGGSRHLELPVFHTVAEAVEATGAEVSGIFVPPAFAADAIMEAIDSGIRVIVVIADGVPVQDMMQVKRYAIGRDTVIIGPNTAGIITPGGCKVGIMPSSIYRPGRIGVVSRSGTLNYEAVEQMNTLGLGQSTALSIGGDPINGCDFIAALREFERDPDTDAVLLIGEIGGPQEVEAAQWARENMSKPLVAYIAGVSAPPGRRMGHAGAIISGAEDTAKAKMARMAELGAHVVENPADIGVRLQQALPGQG